MSVPCTLWSLMHCLPVSHFLLAAGSAHMTDRPSAGGFAHNTDVEPDAQLASYMTEMHSLMHCLPISHSLLAAGSAHSTDSGQLASHTNTDSGQLIHSCVGVSSRKQFRIVAVAHNGRPDSLLLQDITAYLQTTTGLPNIPAVLRKLSVLLLL